MNAGESAIRLASDRREGRFWLAANMGRLAESFGIVQAEGRTEEARVLLRRVIDAPFDAEWAPEDREFKQKSAALLKKIGR